MRATCSPSRSFAVQVGQGIFQDTGQARQSGSSPDEHQPRSDRFGRKLRIHQVRQLFPAPSGSGPSQAPLAWRFVQTCRGHRCPAIETPAFAQGIASPTLGSSVHPRNQASGDSVRLTIDNGGSLAPRETISVTSQEADGPALTSNYAISMKASFSCGRPAAIGRLAKVGPSRLYVNQLVYV